MMMKPRRFRVCRIGAKVSKNLLTDRHDTFGVENVLSLAESTLSGREKFYGT